VCYAIENNHLAITQLLIENGAIIPNEENGLPIPEYTAEMPAVLKKYSPKKNNTCLIS
jgi:hypothetical protein